LAYSNSSFTFRGFISIAGLSSLDLPEKLIFPEAEDLKFPCPNYQKNAESSFNKNFRYSSKGTITDI
jgi:hypothetical protein